MHDDESGRWAARTVALVSVRVLAARLRRQGALAAAQRDLLVAVAQDTPYRQRAWRPLLAACLEAGLPAEATTKIGEAAARPTAEWDVKAQDAAALLDTLRARPVPATDPESPRPSASDERGVPIDLMDVLAGFCEGRRIPTCSAGRGRDCRAAASKLAPAPNL